MGAVPGPHPRHACKKVAWALREWQELKEADDGERTDLVLHLPPEVAEAWGVWWQLQTQWRKGADGLPDGLDYAACQAWLSDYLEDRGSPAPDPSPAHLLQLSRRALWSCLQAMESVQLERVADQRALMAEKHAQQRHNAFES